MGGKKYGEWRWEMVEKEWKREKKCKRGRFAVKGKRRKRGMRGNEGSMCQC